MSQAACLVCLLFFVFIPRIHLGQKATIPTYYKSTLKDSLHQLYHAKVKHMQQQEAMQTFDKWIAPSTQNGNYDPLYSTVIQLKALYYFRLDQQENAVDLITREIEKSNQTDNLRLKCDLLLWLSKHYLFIYDYPKAFENLLRLDKALKKLSYANFPNINDFFEAFTSALYHFRDVEKAQHYIDTAMYYPFTSYRNEINIYNNAALFCVLQKKECAMAYFEHALRIARLNNDTAWTGILSGNLGYEYLKINKLTTAESLLITDYTYSQVTSEFSSAANAGLLLARVKLQQNLPKKALEYIQGVYTLPIMHEDNNFDLLNTYYDVYGHYYRSIGDYQKAIISYDSAVLYKRKFDTINDINAAKRLEEKINTERHLAQLKLLDQEYHQGVFIRNTLIFIACIIILLLGVIYYQYRMKQHKARQVLLLKQENTEEKLVNAQERLQKYVQNIKEKNRLIEKFGEEIEALKTIQHDIDETKKAELKNQLYEQTLLTNEDWYEFKKLFDNVHPGYFERLENRYPQLTFAEKRLFLLHKLGLSPDEMAGMLGISPNSVRRTSLRLRKKLDLAGNADFIKVVHEI
tara:strand:- start:3508 stop:5238 length:1731 start_codon:yes stop_codon:yes gene_type:complete